MALRTFERRITTPAETAQDSPQSTDWELPQGTLVQVTVVIPDGHAGLTGVALRYSGEHVFPFEADSWIEGNGEEVTYPLEFDVGGSAVQVLTFNTDDTYEHDHILRVVHRDPEPVTRRSVDPVPITAGQFVIPTDADQLIEQLEESGDEGELIEEVA